MSGSPTLALHLLGPLEVRVDGCAVMIGSHHQRALLAALALRPGETLSADRLIDALWGERPPATAAKALQVQVSQLRRLIEAPGTPASGARVLVTRPGGGYQLVVGPDAIDARRFERLLAEGTAALASGSPTVSAAKLRDALALWRGRALGELAEEPFAQSESARLEGLRLDAMEARIEADLAAGATGLVPELQALVLEHPLRERLRGQLMLALYRDGRQQEALAAYQAARSKLVEELGIEPGPALQRVHQAVLRQDPALEPRRPAEPPVGADDFVGRIAELGRLQAALDRALAGDGSVVMVGGEPGIGKSRLVERLLATSRERGALVLSARCWEAGGAPAFWPWVEALRAYVRAIGLDAVRRQAGPDVARILPELASAPVQGDDSEGARFRLFEAIGELLAAAAYERPLVIALDDLHAADEPSLLLLRLLARRLPGTRLLVVGTFRDTEVGPGGPLAAALADLSRGGSAERIDLDGLSEHDLGRLIATIVPDPPERLARAVLEETDGNPLFAGELVRMLAAEGSLAAAARAERWEFGLPDALREVIGRRLAALDAATRQVLEAASVLGREFRVDVLEALAGLPLTAVADALHEAERARLTGPVPGTPTQRRFTHALIRDAAYAQLGPQDRRTLHAQAGGVLERAYAGDVEAHSAELAHHFCLAAAAGGDVERAVASATRAARRATGLLAFEEAVRLYELALRALGASAPPAARADIVLGIADAHARAGELERAKRRFREATDLARAAELPDRLARAALGYGGRFIWARSTSEPELLSLLDEALAVLPDHERVLRVQLLARLAGALRPGSARIVDGVRAGPEEAEEYGRQAVALAREVGDRGLLGYALEGLLLATDNPPATRSNLALAEEILAVAESADDRERMFAGLDHIVPLRWTLGDERGVEAALDRAEALAEAMAQPAQRWLAAGIRTMLLVAHGELDAADRHAQIALELGRHALAPANAETANAVHLFLVRRAQGRLGEIEGHVHRTLARYPWYTQLRCIVPCIEGASGRRDAFDALARDGFSGVPFGDCWLFGVSLLAEACVDLGDVDAAGRLYDLLLPYGGLTAVSPIDGSNGCVDGVLGLLARLLGNDVEAERHLTAALDLDERMGARLAVDRSRAALANL